MTFIYRMTCVTGKRTMYDINAGNSGQLESNFFKHCNVNWYLWCLLMVYPYILRFTFTFSDNKSQLNTNTEF